MLLHLAPRDWFFIFMALLLCTYMRLASAKTQPGYQIKPAIARAFNVVRF
jgi:hypothetical protein